MTEQDRRAMAYSRRCARKRRRRRLARLQRAALVLALLALPLLVGWAK